MEINCPSCNEAVLIADEDKATTIECPFCQQRFALEKPEPLHIEKSLIPPPSAAPSPPPSPPRPKRAVLKTAKELEGNISKATTKFSNFEKRRGEFLATGMVIFGLITFVINFIKFFLRSASGTYTAEPKSDDCFTHCALGLIIAGIGTLIHQLNKKSKKVID